MKKKLISGIIFLVMCITSTLIYASIDAKVEMNPSTITYKPGDEVTLRIKVKDIVSENGANGIEGTISYDTEKFEELKAENITKVGPWDVAYYNGKVIAEGLSAVKEDTEIISIKLRIKEDNSLIGKTANVSFNNIVVYNTEKVDLGTVSSSIKIAEKASIEIENNTPTPTSNPDEKDEPETTPTPTATAKPTSTPNGGSESTPTPSTKPNTTGAPTATAKPNSGENKNNVPITNINTNTSSGSSSSNKGTTGSTTSSNSLPKAGISSAIAILSVAAVALGTVAYIKLRKYKEI